MLLKTTKQTLETLKNDYVRVRFVDKGSERLLERDGVTELHIGVGKLEKLTPRTLRTCIRDIVISAKKYKLAKVAVSFNETHFPGLTTYGATWFWQTVAENLHLADYEFTRYKSKTPKSVLKEILLTDVSETVITSAVKRGEIVGTYTNICRDIANTPGGDMTPELLGKAAQEALKGTKATVKVLDHKAITKLKMGGLLGVGQGAFHKPRFIVIEYKGIAKSSTGPIVFVGKGVTFDTGGLQVKPGMSMYEMHMDMSGGAAVIAAIGAIATLGLKQHVIGLIPAAENAISDTAIRPGDVITMMSGATVDVLHTDAEGRIILADALHYAKRFKPRLVIDVATLTGAALVAVGQHAHVIMTKDRELEDTLRDLGEESGDYVFHSHSGRSTNSTSKEYMVTSQTFRQAIASTEEALTAEPSSRTSPKACAGRTSIWHLV
jgi:leucyl aminopeptidase